MGQNGEQSRILVHTLNYISHDYVFAVKDGKVISKDEYDEELEFAEAAVKYYKQFSPSWSDADSAAIGIQIHRLDSLIDIHAPFTVVSALASDTKTKVIKASGLIVTPTRYPDLQIGKIIFRTECAKCHGNDGYGDGPEGKELEPKPRNFRDNERMKTISPFTAFNTIRLGIEGTGMKPHPTLDDDQVWNVAFYVVSLRYQSLSTNPKLKEEKTQDLVNSLALEKIATASDEDFTSALDLKDSTEQQVTLGAIRLHQPVADESEFVNTSLKYLDGAMELYMQGKYAEASQMAALSYLEGIEPIEGQLKASDPALMEKLEEQMQRLRKMMDENHPLIEVKDSVNAVRTTIGSINEVVNKKNYSFWLALLLAASILLREGLEAFLVIMVILSVMGATELKNFRRYVHGGWIIAVLVGIALWLFGGSLMKGQLKHIELIEGGISFVAVLMLLYVGFWLHSKSEIGKWKEYVTKMMKGIVHRESMFGLAALSFFVVFREVFESVLFLSALNIESGGEQANAIVLGVFTAFVLVVAMASVVIKFSARLPIPKLFKISSFVMGVLAVVLVGKGVHSFQIINLIKVHGLPMFRVELLGIFPTIETCLAQLLTALVVAIIWRTTISPKK
jgi:high-affinity iron transporter